MSGQIKTLIDRMNAMYELDCYFYIWSIVNLSQLWHLLLAKRIKTDKKHIKNCIFSLKYLVNPIKSSIFAPLEPAKPLNDAQMCGSFYFYTMSNRIPFPKPYTSAHDLISPLQSRGLTIANTTKTERYLEFIGYYRLSAYMYPLLQMPKEQHRYKPNTTFDQVMMLYRFDKKLRLLIFNEIEKIEVAVRSAIVNIGSDMI